MEILLKIVFHSWKGKEQINVKNTSIILDVITYIIYILYKHDDEFETRQVWLDWIGFVRKTKKN